MNNFTLKHNIYISVQIVKNEAVGRPDIMHDISRGPYFN